jgi:hypothetical protein
MYCAIYATFCREEVLEHADAVVTRDVEGPKY